MISVVQNGDGSHTITIDGDDALVVDEAMTRHHQTILTELIQHWIEGRKELFLKMAKKDMMSSLSRLDPAEKRKVQDILDSAPPPPTP